jgi:oxygen-dependent protoporphyrinogen oxidase
MPKVVIVGAGISGLTIAFRLRQALPTVEVVVLEQRDRPGGNIWTERRDGYQIEIGPNGFLDSKPSTIGLCRELGLADRLVPASEGAARNRYLFLNGKLQILPGGMVELLRSTLLSWRGKFGLLTEPLRRPRRANCDESVHDFARRRAGQEVADILADGLVTGIYAGDPALLSIAAAFPRLKAFEEQHGSVFKGFILSSRERRRAAAAEQAAYQRSTHLWSFRDGLRLLVETLGRQLDPAPIVGVSVRRLERTDRPGWRVVAAGKDCWPADAVVLACPAHQQAGILGSLDGRLADEIAKIAYNQIAVVAVGYRRVDVPGNLYGFGYIAPQRTRRDLLGVQWCSSIFPERAAPGTVLLRALAGGWHRPDLVGWDDDRLLQAIRHELRLAMRITALPVFHSITRWQRAIPQYHLGHLERVTWIEQQAARFSGLFLAGNAYHGVALNDCTEQGQLVAGRIKDYLTSIGRR